MFKDREKLDLEIEKLLQAFKDNNAHEFVPGVSPIPPSGKVIDLNEIKFMISAALDGWLTTGRFNDEFEKKLASFIGIKNLRTVNSGSSANLVAFSALTSEKLGSDRVRSNDEVITVAAGFPTTINPIFQNNCIPVFVDVDSKTHNIDVNKIEDAISNKTRAIMIAHSLGNPFDIEPILSLCRKYNLFLVEDCCDALGSKYNNQNVGTFGHISTLSFYPAHHITMGEGGAVFTNDHTLTSIVESFRDWGRDCYCKPGFDNTCNKRFQWKLGDLPFGYDHKYIYSHTGFNLKITDMQAACALGQLAKLPLFIDSRKKNFEYLYKSLKDCEEFIQLPCKLDKSDPSWFGFPLTVREDSPVKREDIINYLNQKKIGTRLLFAGNVTKQPYLKNLNYKISNNLDNTDKIMNNTFWIGLYPGLTNEMLDFSVYSIRQILGIDFD